MKTNPLNNLVNQMAVQKKKSIVAVGLVLLMGFMWVRVLTGDDTQAVSAAVLSGTTQGQPAVQKLKVTFLELPKVEGRHDVLNRDFFKMDDVVFGTVNQAKIVNGQSSAIEVAERLRLEAIVTGEHPEAFINDKIVKVGQKLNVEDGSKIYECEIVKIQENLVIVKYENSEIELKLKQPNEAN